MQVCFSTDYDGLPINTVNQSVCKEGQKAYFHERRCLAITVSYDTVEARPRLATAYDLVYTELVFDWDAQRANANQLKHGVSFEEAATAFLDPYGLDGEDLEHSLTEPRRLRLAKSSLGRILVIAYTIRRQGNEEVTRIISARRASQKERKRYEAKED